MKPRRVVSGAQYKLQDRYYPQHLRKEEFIIKQRKVVSLLLAVVMLVSLWPVVPVSTEATTATTTNKNIMFGTSHIEGAQNSNVYFGTYKQSSDGNGRFNIDPIKWRVLANENDTLFLFADQKLDMYQYHTSSLADVTWATCAMRSWLNRTGSGNFLGDAFSSSEQAAIATTTVVNDTSSPFGTSVGKDTQDKVFLLSESEAQKTTYGFINSESRRSSSTAYVEARGGTSSSNPTDGGWWLRSPSRSPSYALLVRANGDLNFATHAPVVRSLAVRPAFKIDGNSVLFTSAAKGGKSSGDVGASALKQVSDYTGSDWKLTLEDSSRNSFSASAEESTTTYPGGTVCIKYDNAKTGSNEYVSAFLCDSNNDILYYGHIAQNSASGSLDLKIPSSLSTGTYTLKVFSEQCNGDDKTDFAGEFKDIPITVKKQPQPSDFTYTAPTDLTYDGSIKEAAVEVNSGTTGMGSITAIKYYNSSGTELDSAPKDVGTYIVKIDVKEGDTYAAMSGITDDSWKFTIYKKAPIASQFTYTPPTSNLTYDGTEKEAKVTVKSGTTGMGSITAIKYYSSSTKLDSAPKDAGTYTVKIDVAEGEIYAGASDLTDSSWTFTIAAASISDATVTVPDAVYTGSARTPDPTVELGGTTLVEDSDYTVEYSNNTAIGEATVTVTGIGNYTGTATSTFQIAYFSGAPDATVSGKKGTGDWYISEVTLTPPEGYSISKTNENYTDSISYTTEQNGDVTYYLKRNSDDQVAQKTMNLKINLTDPTAEYSIKENEWRKFVNFFTFGFFCKENAELTIQSSSAKGYTVATEYLISTTQLEPSKITDWQRYESPVAIDDRSKNYIYVRVTDDTGRQVIYESGVVVFSNCEEIVSSTYYKGTSTNATAEIGFKGNTVKEVKYKGESLASDTYTVTDNGIEFDADYLNNNFSASDTPYSFTVSYLPMGVEMGSNPVDDKPADTTINIMVKKQEGSVTNIENIGKEYDGKAVKNPTYTSLSKGGATFKYKASNADDSTYSTVAPKNAGDYVVRVTVEGDETYLESSSTSEFTISKRALTVTAKDETATYGAAVPNYTVTYSGFAEGETENVLGGTLAFDCDYAQFSNKGEYTITPKGCESLNYSFIYESGKLKVDAKPINDATVTVPDAVYTGSARTPDPTVKLDGTTLVKDRDYTVKYSDNTAIGKATVTVTGTGNYTGMATSTFQIDYFSSDLDATVSGKKGTDDWYISEVTLIAPDGCKISKTGDNYTNFISYTTEQSGKVTYYLKADSSGGVEEKTMNLKINLTDPTAKYSIKKDEWREFVNFVTFGIFCKDNAELTIESSSAKGYTVATEWLISTTRQLEPSKITGWKSYESPVAIDDRLKNYIYVRVTDETGRQVIYESGVVVFNNCEEIVSSTYYKGTSTDVTAGIDFKGNTVKEVKRGSETLNKGTQYTVTSNGIKFDAVYLNTLSASDTPYSFTVSYLPMGVEMGSNPVGDKPTDTTINITVEKQAGSVTDIENIGKTYDGKAVKNPTYTSPSTGDATFEYKASDADDSTYSTVAPKDAGDYVVRVTVAGDETYLESSSTSEFTISKKELTVTAENKTVTYGDAVPNYAVTYSGFADGEKETDLDGTLAFDCDYAQFSNKGEYTITPRGYESPNYSFNYVKGKLKVDAKPINVTIKSKQSIYGDEIVPLTSTDDGIVNNDQNVYKLETTASKTAGVGQYNITGTTLNANYDISFVNGENAYEITKRELTVTVVVADKKYDGLNTATIESAQLNNIVNDDDVSLVNGTATFESVDVKNGIGITFTEFSLSGEENVLKNYTLTQPTGVEANIINGWFPSEYTVSTPNSNGWLKENFVIEADKGYKLSYINTENGAWGETLIGAEEGKKKSITFYMRNDTDGTISTAKTESYSLDKTPPTGKVYFDERSAWKSFVNTISFNLFFKEEVKVQAEVADKFSDVASIEYASSDREMTLVEVQALTDWKAMPTGGVAVPLEDAKRFVYFVRITDNADNVTYISTDGAEYVTTAPEVSGVENDKTCYTTQKVTIPARKLKTVTVNGKTVFPYSEIVAFSDEPVFEENLSTFALNNEPVFEENLNAFARGEEPDPCIITLEGNKDDIYIIVVTDKAGNTTTVTVTMKPISSIKLPIKDITEDNVKSSDRDTIQAVSDQVDELLNDVNTTDGEREELQWIKADTEKLLKKIEAANGSANTENTEKIQNVTSENVAPKDKDDLKNAKDDLKKALDENSGNYTEEEKKAIEDAINRIDKALEVIDNVEAAEGKIISLPDNITKDNADAVKAAKEAYDSLSDYEKSLVDPSLKEKLDAALEFFDNVKEVEDQISSLPENITKDDGDAVNAAKEAYDSLSDYEKSLVDPSLKEKLDAALEILDNVKETEDQISSLPDNITKDDGDVVKAAKEAYDSLSDYEKSLIDPDLKKKLDDAIKALEEASKPADTDDNTIIITGNEAIGDENPDGTLYDSLQTGDTTNLYAVHVSLISLAALVVMIRRKKNPQ